MSNEDKYKERLEEWHGEPMICLGAGDVIQKSIYDDSGWKSIAECNEEVARLAFHCQRCGIVLFVEDEITCDNICDQEYYCQTCGKREDTWYSLDDGRKCGPCCGEEGNISRELENTDYEYKKNRWENTLFPSHIN